MPFDLEIGTSIGYVLIYQIVLYFSKLKKDYTSANIVKMTIERIQNMHIILVDIPKLVAPLCNSRGFKAWNGMIRIHLKEPINDGTTLFNGERVFALELDRSLHVAKAAKGYNSLTPIKDLSATITSSA